MDVGSPSSFVDLPLESIAEADAPPWRPSNASAFRPFSADSPAQSSPRLIRSRAPLLTKFTKDILETFRRCNPDYRYQESHAPRRYLTNPSVGVYNDGQDNMNSDLILYVNLELLSQNIQRRYIVKEMLGQGTFGQVVKCWDSVANTYVAVKVIKNQPAYFRQAMVEVSILCMLSQKIDQENHQHIVRILDYFEYQNHLCITFEMLGLNLYELLKANSLRGLSYKIVQSFTEQILKALVIMKDAGIIHCDLKPENILISPKEKTAEIKVIDFGSACNEGRTVYSYIQSRYYRSPEVLLGYPYTTAIDMWSLGCIVAELFVGVPVFPGLSEYDLLQRIIAILGAHPPDSFLRDAKNTSKFFKHVGSIFSENGTQSSLNSSAYRLLTEEEFEAREKEKPKIGKWFIPKLTLEDLIVSYPWRRRSHEEENLTEKSLRMALVDFIRGLLELDPSKRWSPRQALLHPFITGRPFTAPYNPSPETARIPVACSTTIYHNKGGGHFLATGLSPQVRAVNRGISSSNSHFPRMPLSYGSSYGSLGSYGSHNDNVAHGSSFGSYGEVNAGNMYYSPFGPSGLNSSTQGVVSLLGSSPEVRRRPHIHGNGFAYSPGSIGHMSVGASPSQYTPPNSQIPGLASSPGKYGSASPSRGIHGSPLGKSAGGSHKRRNWSQHPSFMQPHEYPPQTVYSRYNDAASCIIPDGHIRGNAGHAHSLVPNSTHYSRRPPFSGGSNMYSDVYSYCGACTVNPEHEPYLLHDRQEVVSLAPAAWDPFFSDDSLLQEENVDPGLLSSEFSKSVHLGNSATAAANTVGDGRFEHGQSRAPTEFNLFSSNPRAGQTQTFIHGGNNHHAIPQSYTSYGRANLQTSFSYNHQHAQQLSDVSSSYMDTGRSHQIRKPIWPNHGLGDQQSASSTSMGDTAAWGGTVGYPFGTNFPPSSAKRDYGRIT